MNTTIIASDSFNQSVSEYQGMPNDLDIIMITKIECELLKYKLENS